MFFFERRGAMEENTNFDDKCLTHEVIARGVIVHEDSILLCKPKNGKYCYLPGGHVDPGEDSKHAIIREISEELGVDSVVERFLGVVEFSYEKKPSETIYELNLVYEVKIDENICMSLQSREDYIEFFWHPISDLVNTSLEPFLLRDTLQGWLENQDIQNIISSYL